MFYVKFDSHNYDCKLQMWHARMEMENGKSNSSNSISNSNFVKTNVVGLQCMDKLTC